MKQCKKCHEIKNLDLFGKDKSQKDGRTIYCKPCVKAISAFNYIKYKTKHDETAKKYQENNHEKIAIYRKKWYAKNKERISEISKKWAANNRDKKNMYAKNSKNKAGGKERCAEYARRHRQKNKNKTNYYASLYRSNKLRATPIWLTDFMKADIEHTYLLASTCSRASDNTVIYCVDHIIPLNNPNVCGLHVPWNLQILTKSQNSAKHNKLMEVTDGRSYF